MCIILLFPKNTLTNMLYLTNLKKLIQTTAKTSKPQKTLNTNKRKHCFHPKFSYQYKIWKSRLTVACIQCADK